MIDSEITQKMLFKISPITHRFSKKYSMMFFRSLCRYSSKYPYNNFSQDSLNESLRNSSRDFFGNTPKNSHSLGIEILLHFFRDFSQKFLHKFIQEFFLALLLHKFLKNSQEILLKVPCGVVPEVASDISTIIPQSIPFDFFFIFFRDFFGSSSKHSSLTSQGILSKMHL